MHRKRLTSMFAIGTFCVMLAATGVAVALTAAPVARARAGVPAARRAVEALPSAGRVLNIKTTTCPGAR